jgi:4,5-DOPA dioxygenase extradiol
MNKITQPSLFISHGTMYEAFKSEQLKADFAAIRKEHIPENPAAIVLFSGHWQTENVAVTTSNVMAQMDEGFPDEFTTEYKTSGHTELANRIIELLNNNNIKATEDSIRMLDHGALIPLMLLFPEAGIPVIQISQRYDLNTNYHKQIATILAPLKAENILFIGSGGLVHNRNEIVKMSGHSLPPSNWAKAFDDFVTNQLLSENDVANTDKMIKTYEDENFEMAHPTTEHFLPIVFMTNNLFTEYISTEANAKILLLFGGNIERRHEIISLLQPLINLSVYGALSEEEGMEMLQQLNKVDLVLIGGRYSDEQRIRIRAFLQNNYPAIQLTEPGVDYAYSNDAIFATIQNMLHNETT